MVSFVGVGGEGAVLEVNCCVCGVILTPVEPVGRLVVVGWSGLTL